MSASTRTAPAAAQTGQTSARAASAQAAARDSIDKSAGIDWHTGDVDWWCGRLVIVGRLGLGDYLGQARAYTGGEDVLSWPVGRWASLAAMSRVNLGDTLLATGAIPVQWRRTL